MFEIKRDLVLKELEFIETKCPREACDKPYRIDEHHPQYAVVKRSLESGDRSILFCYHTR